jgi:hypothetical protein
MADWAISLRRGEPDRLPYRIIHIFPDTSIALRPFVSFRVLGRRIAIRSPMIFPLVVIQRGVAEAHDRSCIEIRVAHVGPNGNGRTLASRLSRALVRQWMRLLSFLPRRIFREDAAVCEALQLQARQIAADPTYGAAEARVGWFNEAYAEAMQPEAPPP